MSDGAAGLFATAEVGATLAENLAGAFGESGRAFVRALPAQVAACCTRWGLRLRERPPSLSYSWVGFVEDAAGRALALKLGVPGPGLSAEIAATRLLGGAGVRLVEADPQVGALLLERVVPGEDLVSLPEAEATDALADRIAALPRAVAPGTPDLDPLTRVADLGRGFARHRARHCGGSGPIPVSLFERAEARFGELAGSMAADHVLHGDLHHANVLRGRTAFDPADAPSRLVVIDPKGFVGEPAYEVGALLRNPIERRSELSELPALQAKRVDVLCERTGFERARVVGWGFAQAVLSACWLFEDGAAVDDDRARFVLACGAALAELEA